MNDWVVETPSLEEDLMNNRFVMLNQNGVNKVVEIMKEKDKEIESLREHIINQDRIIADANNRLYKATEYIESNAPWGEETEDGDFVSGKLLQDGDIDYILDILKGSDKE